MARTKTKRKTSIGVLFWIAFILFLLVVFLFSRSQIQHVLQSTGLVQVVKDKFGGKPVAEAPLSPGPGSTGPTSGAPGSVSGSGKGSPSQQTAPGSTVVITTAPNTTGAGATTQTGSNSGPANTASGSQTATRTSTQTPSPANGKASSAGGQTASTQATTSTQAGNSSATDSSVASGSGDTTSTTGGTSQPAYHTRLSTIYFTHVSSDGRITPEAVVREVRYVDSPLTDTIDALLKGPTAEELNKGLLNLIPEKTKLLSAQIQNGIAYLNFNDAFEFNPMGVEGALAQLKQIVHTATEFPNVSRVQVLINGKKLDYLGGEGIFVGRPLSKDSFS